MLFTWLPKFISCDDRNNHRLSWGYIRELIKSGLALYMFQDFAERINIEQSLLHMLGLSYLHAFGLVTWFVLETTHETLKEHHTSLGCHVKSAGYNKPHTIFRPV